MHAYMPVPTSATPFIGVTADMITQIVSSTERQARKDLDRALDRARIPRGRRHLVKGAPSEAIPRTARALRAHIAVMGAISRSALKRIVIGNTAERVLGELPCDVLVVKPARFVTRVSHTRRGVRYTVSSEIPMPY
jgi:universal stress protein E